MRQRKFVFQSMGNSPGHPTENACNVILLFTRKIILLPGIDFGTGIP